MVFLAFVLLTVSTLATLINAEPTNQLVVNHACEGEVLCDVKPDNYPQEEIDMMLMKHLPYLHRMKRAAPEPAPASTEGNCKVRTSEMTSPFTLKTETGVPHIIVQSRWFEQKVPKVTCWKENEECFTSYTLPISGTKTQCVTKNLVSSVVVYNTVDKQFENVSTTIGIDCACVIKHK